MVPLPASPPFLADGLLATLAAPDGAQSQGTLLRYLAVARCLLSFTAEAERSQHGESMETVVSIFYG